ncbi:MAG: GIY-YIG nuclease family protein [Cyclobacteriaceae bacterium]
MFFAYVLKSQVSGRHYYGHSKDLDARLKSHNGGKVRSTKAHRPWEMIYYEEFKSKSEAYKREMFFKSIDGYNYLKERGII